jgi:hypothetical protein
MRQGRLLHERFEYAESHETVAIVGWVASGVFGSRPHLRRRGRSEWGYHAPLDKLDVPCILAFSSLPRGNLWLWA